MELQAVECGDAGHQNGGYHSRRNSVRNGKYDKYEPRFHREVCFIQAYSMLTSFLSTYVLGSLLFQNFKISNFRI